MKKSLLLAVASLAVIACSKRTIGEAPVDPNLPADNVVRFSSAGGVTVTRAGLDKDGHSTFDVNDEIGIYAVLHGKSLGTLQTSSNTLFPANTDFQYFNRQYKVTKVDPYDDTTDPSSPVQPIAHFEPVVDAAAVAPKLTDNTMYYLSGGQGWNYYAYYPYSLVEKLTNAAGTADFVIPATLATAATATPSPAANFIGKSDKGGWSLSTPKPNFFDQTKLVLSTSTNAVENTYPGPIMFAYYGQEDSQAALGTAQKAVRLPFKYAIAKLTLNVKISEDVIAVPTTGTTNTNITQLLAIAMDGNEMYQGFTFDLTKARTVGASTGVYDVITTIDNDNVNAPAMTSWDVKTKKVAPNFTDSDPYTGYLFKVPDAADTKINAQCIEIPGTTPKEYKKGTEFVVTGFLIPAGNVAGADGKLTNVEIKFYVSKQTGGKDPEVYTVTLDQTKGGTVTGGNPAPKNYLPAIAPGKEYKFNITLDKNKITFEGEVEDWDVVEPAGSDEIPAV